jgi:hypothetical protein
MVRRAVCLQQDLRWYLVWDGRPWVAVMPGQRFRAGGLQMDMQAFTRPQMTVGVLQLAGAVIDALWRDVTAAAGALLQCPCQLLQ